MSGKNQRFSCRWTDWVREVASRLKFTSSRNLPIILEDYIKHTSNEWKKNRKMSTCIQLDLESLGSWPTIPKNFMGTGNEHIHIEATTTFLMISRARVNTLFIIEVEIFVLIDWSYRVLLIMLNIVFKVVIVFWACCPIYFKHVSFRIDCWRHISLHTITHIHVSK